MKASLIHVLRSFSLGFLRQGLTGRPGTLYVSHGGLKLMILLPQLPEYWDYRYVPSIPGVLGEGWSSITIPL
jgi:hypothetical protein